MTSLVSSATATGLPARPILPGLPTGAADRELQQAASIALADLEPPFAAVFVEVTKMTTGQALHINWCAEPGDEELLLVGYDAARVPRSVVDCIVARGYGVPAEVFEVTI
jgi:hypothetical protein